jgi:hypothetical protein
MISYKTIALRRNIIAGMPAPAPLLAGQAHSLEHYLGVFLRTHTQRYTEKGFFWIKTVCIPVVVRFTKNTIELITYLIKYIGVRLSHRIQSLRNENVLHSGASSFFLKDITEHKKNLKKDERL